MQTRDRALMATLAYFGVQGWPLTPWEVWQRLIPASRLGAASARPPLDEVVSRLAVLAAKGTLKSHRGLYGPKGMDAACFDERIAREKEHARKWRVLRPYVRWLAAAPFARALLASGSLAAGNSGPLSDWDVLVVAEHGRLYTARFSLLAIAWFQGRLRTKAQADAADRFCFNHWLTTDGLRLRHESLFTARVLASLVPMWDPGDYLKRLVQANGWLRDYGPRPSGGPWVRRTVEASLIAEVVRRAAEALLVTPLGDIIERALKTWMQRRIAAEPATHARNGRVIADDYELEFHPRSQEATVLASYNAVLTGLGLGAYHERDSGLTR